jgi:hypothetical protein
MSAAGTIALILGWSRFDAVGFVLHRATLDEEGHCLCLKISFYIALG